MSTGKIVTVKNISIGHGIPKICVPIVGKTAQSIVKEAENIVNLPVDLVEWRLDFYEEIEHMSSVIHTLRRLREVLPQTPILCTFRTRGEGGEKSITADAYMRLYKEIVQTGYCDLIDVELFAGDRLPSDSENNSQEDFFRKMVEIAHDYDVKVVASNHDFHKTPEAQEIVFRLCKMQGLGADIAKIAVMPQNPNDVDVLLNATIHMSREYAMIPIVTMSMGELGTISRINGQLTGSAITFGSASQTSAPGQIPVQELKKALEMINTSEFIRQHPSEAGVNQSKKNIYLIGFMGTGKSSVSAALRAQLGYEELDTDALIEQQQGTSISAIFEKQGEAYFRQLETECLKELQGTQERIISCGGGMAVKPENVQWMKKNGTVVLLTATPETVLERVKDDDSRPVLRGHKTIQGITQLMEKRRETYESAADVTVKTDDKTIKDIADEIVQKIFIENTGRI